MIAATLSGGILERWRWTELNIGPFTVDTQGDFAIARDDLDSMEQVRWVLGGLLETPELRAVWPIRVVLNRSSPGGACHFGRQIDEYLLVCPPKQAIPLSELAGIFLEANTPPLPGDTEAGLRELFSTLEAGGSHVTWGGPVGQPDLAYARMQLFATKFEYRSSFHIFVTSLKNGSSLAVAERNAFGKDPAVLEKEVAENLQRAATWTPESVSGRPLDPKRDLGEHAVDGTLINAFVAFSELTSNPAAADRAFKAAIESGGRAKGLGLAGLAAEAARDGEDPHQYLQDAIAAGDLSASLYVDSSQGEPPAKALGLLQIASKLNPLWAEPVYEQVGIETNPVEKEKLLKHVAELDQRKPRYWVELAQLQTADGHAIEAQSSWQRAEDEAVGPGERARIHSLRVGSEQARLDAADKERISSVNAAHEDELRAQQAEQDRIRAAEEKANQTLDAQAGTARPQNPVPWDQALVERKLSGNLTRVDCLAKTVRITIKDRSGHETSLVLRDTLPATLSCGVQQPPRRAFITYAEDPDDNLHTAGHVRSLRLP